MSFDLLFNKANELYLSGAYGQAEEIYRQILAFAPENANVLNMLGLVASAQNEHHQAVRYFYEALKKAPNPLPVYFNLAVSLTSIAKFSEAIEAYEHVLKIAPNTKEAYNNLGGIYEKTGELEKAKENYRKATNLDENYVDALVNLAVLENNETELTSLSLKFENSPLPFYYLSLSAYEKGDFDKALSFALKADKCQEAYDIKNLTAQIYLRLKDIENAIKYFHQALILNPKSLDALINLGTLENEESFFKKALSLDIQNSEAHLAYADFLVQDGRKAEALEQYRSALLLGGDNAALSNNIGLILKDMADYKGALDLFFNAFLKDKSNQDIAVNMAETLVLLHNNDPKEAVKIAKLWVKNAPNNVFALKTLAAFENKVFENDKEYVSALFDEFAGVYEKQMENIDYNVLSKIKELSLKIKGYVLDLGCGTGLAAEKLKTSDSNWTGVDISQKMLDIAQEKQLYDKLIQADILDFLGNNKLKFDIVLCLDVIEYIENYENLFKYCFPSKLVFSIEKAPDHIHTFSVNPQGRYEHNPEYIKNLLKTIGYQSIEMHALTLRKENSKDVEGVLFICNEA
ncbi:MAG: tetratricopeptide repeat protein [Alphaproteobacteria bacterium]|nr:tetratricopeptide repeat protein [Alphaproteobacteria bacterium]